MPWFCATSRNFAPGRPHWPANGRTRRLNAPGGGMKQQNDNNMTSSTMRPYIICHMMASIDGRIDCSMVDKISGDEYYTALGELDCPSTLEGRVTMEHYSALEGHYAAKDPAPVDRPSFYMAQQAKGYAIAADTMGRLQWPSNEIDGVPLLCITSERAPLEYLNMLRSEGISYIAVGNPAIDLAGAMKTLRGEFGVERLALLGGGNINGGFLVAGLIDEVSLMIGQGIDGRKGQTAVFDGITNEGWMPAKMALADVKRLDCGTVWLRYRAERP